MIGHSVGEYVAACVSGTMTRDDALTAIARRARLMQDMPPGAMLAVRTGSDDVAPFLGDDLAVAAYNSPSLTVISA